MEWVDTVVVAAIIAAFASVAVFGADRYLASLSRKREKAADALSEALLWMEMPYRIARRTSDVPETLAELASAMHHLQERQVFNRAWLQVEVPEAYDAYRDLLDDMRTQCAPHLTDAWNRPSVDKPADMNLGTIYPVDVQGRIDTYVRVVREALRPRLRIRL